MIATRFTSTEKQQYIYVVKTIDPNGDVQEMFSKGFNPDDVKHVIEELTTLKVLEVREHE